MSTKSQAYGNITYLYFGPLIIRRYVPSWNTDCEATWEFHQSCWWSGYSHAIILFGELPIFKFRRVMAILLRISPVVILHDEGPIA